ncbi:MAG: trypsin-like peptidase domain-containing protein [Chloroflexota bacterium]|nr:trypsin-like peptidase domain-containing protein [Chloroflexota bacterium]
MHIFQWRTLAAGLAALATLTACAPGPEPAPTPTPAPTNTPEPVTVNLEEVGGIIMSSPEPGMDSGNNVYVVTFDASKIVSRVMPAVVTVINEQQFDNGFAGSQSIEAGRGTGFVIDGSGNVVTNEHVVRGGTHFQVILSNGEKREATLVGSDPLSDLAVVRMEGEPLSTVSFGDSDALQQGQPVLAIGSPLGEFTGTVTSGIISALDRDFPTDVSGSASEGIYTDLIQHDAAINPGNSGGPLFDLAGRVIGVNTLGIPEERGTPVQGLFFAIPANHVARIVGEIIQDGRVSYPYFGISYIPISPDLAAQNDLSVDYGAYVQRVEPGAAADRADIRAGDIIVAVGNDRITAQTTFTEVLFAHAPGETVPVTVIRNGREQTLQATLAERPGE